MFKKPNNSGWILCPSKSYPGKFYYFNVLNGDAAWCLNEKEKKVLRMGVTIQKVNENHLYPEPITPPNHPSPRGSNYHRTVETFLPTFGKAVFPKYIANDKEDAKMVSTPIQMLQLVTNTKKMLDQNTQTEDNIKVHTHRVPLTKRFEKKYKEGFGSINYIVANQPKDWWNSTKIWSNIGKQCSTTDMQYKHKIFTKTILKESKLKKLHCKNKTDIWNKIAKEDSIQFNCNEVKNPKANMLTNLDINDLRYVLRAKRRKSVEISDVHNTVNKEHSTFIDTKKVTFNVRDNAFYKEDKYEGEESPYTNNENQQVWYLVADLDVLLEDFDIINCYIENDEHCRLYVPEVVQNELKSLCMGEHNGRSRVIAARQLLRQLESNWLRLNIPENDEYTKNHQIINCCLEIIKQKCNAVLITKDIELIHTAKLYNIQVYHINHIKSNNLENNFIDTNNNIFLQNTDDFDPFSLSKIVRTENKCEQNISGHKESLFNKLSHINVNSTDMSDVIINISKLNINNNIFKIKRKFKNNSFENNIVKSNNYNLPTLFQNINTNETAERNSKKVIINNSKKLNINFENNPEHCRNVNLISKPLNFGKTNNILEDLLEQFKISNHIVEHNLYVRFDEWVCFYEQIIEEFLYIILQENFEQVNQPPPWFLHEGLECLKEIYRDNKYIIKIIERLLYYYDYTPENGTNIRPYNFMKLFGCGFYLVEALEKTSPLCISDIKNKLIYLKDMLESPVEDFIVDTPMAHNTEDKHTDRYNFVKNPSEVLDYLKKHFSEWKSYNEGCDDTDQIEQEVYKDNIKVVRTCGRDLNKFTINKSKCLSFIKETDKQTHNNFQSNNHPTVIRNITLLEKYEEKIKNKEKCLDDPEIAENISNITFYDENNNNNRDAENNDFGVVSLNNDFSINDINDSTKDSGFDSSLHTYNLVRHFLSELSSSFKIIHTFIDESIKDYSEDIDEENKKNLYEKANKTHTHIAEIIDKLKNIIQRESVESSTLKSLLIRSGKDDKRTTRYRPVVMKCLEQATILENSLRLMLAITNDEVLSVSSKESIHFINIYE